MKTLIRATFGRLTVHALSRVTIGHIQIEGTVLDKYGRRVGHTGGKAGNNGVRFIPLTNRFYKQQIKEDRELIDILLSMIEGNLI